VLVPPPTEVMVVPVSPKIELLQSPPLELIGKVAKFETVAEPPLPVTATKATKQSNGAFGGMVTLI
jgi:hypothetical protein